MDLAFYILLAALVGSKLLHVIVFWSDYVSQLPPLLNRPAELFTYLGSFLYVVIKVHNSMKFVRGKSIQDALKSSSRLYLIALSETLFIVTVASSLVSPVTNLGTAVDPTTNLYGTNASLPGDRLSFGFFPALVFLWTGVALFIGSVVQLLLEDKESTAPV